MPSLGGTLPDWFRDWLTEDEASSVPDDPDLREEVQTYLTERRAEMCHWLFVVRAGLALGLAAYLAVSALVMAEAWPTDALLLAVGYALANGAVRFGGGRQMQAAPWAYAFLDFGLILLLYVFFGGTFEFALPPGVGLVGLMVLLLLAYTLLGNPTLNAVLSLAALGAASSVLHFFPDLAVQPVPANAPQAPLRSYLLLEYLSIACLVTCLLALRLRRRLVAYTTEMHRRLKANLEAQLEEDRRHHLEAIGQLKRDFIKVLSHELRNPVAPLISSLEVVQEDAAQGHCNPELVEVAVNSARELQRLADDYTQLAKLLTRPLDDATRWNLPLAPLAKATTAHLTRRLEEDGSSTAPHFAFEALDDRAVASDPPLLRDTMHALIRRAVHHTAEGGIITVRGLSEKDQAGFAVHDPDSYLPADTVASLDDLFAPSEERLYSTDTTGLELLLARHALDRMGGHLHAESSPEHGTTIYCLLPTASSELEWMDDHRVRALLSDNANEPDSLIRA